MKKEHCRYKYRFIKRMRSRSRCSISIDICRSYLRFSFILKPTNISTEKWPFKGEKGKKKKESSVRHDDY